MMLLTFESMVSAVILSGASLLSLLVVVLAAGQSQMAKRAAFLSQQARLAALRLRKASLPLGLEVHHHSTIPLHAMICCASGSDKKTLRSCYRHCRVWREDYLSLTRRTMRVVVAALLPRAALLLPHPVLRLLTALQPWRCIAALALFRAHLRVTLAARLSHSSWAAWQSNKKKIESKMKTPGCSPGCSLGW